MSPRHGFVLRDCHKTETTVPRTRDRETWSEPAGISSDGEVRSHFGRHWFTTYWDVHQDISSEMVAYMRGDAAGNRSAGGSDVMSHYMLVYYEDVDELYRERELKLGV